MMIVGTEQSMRRRRVKGSDKSSSYSFRPPLLVADSWDSAFRDRNRRLEAEGQLGFARDHRRVAARSKHQARPAGATRASADRRAFTAAGDGADRRANARADADLHRVFLLRAFGYLRVGTARKIDRAPVRQLQATQSDGHRSPAFHPSAGIGVDDHALDLRAPL